MPAIIKSARKVCQLTECLKKKAEKTLLLTDVFVNCIIAEISSEQAKAHAWSRVKKLTVEHPRDRQNTVSPDAFFIAAGGHDQEVYVNRNLLSEKNTDTQKVAVRVSMVSIIGNLLLTAFKFLAGILAHSGAMVSDAVHSASDVISSVIVIAGVKVAAKTEDEHHPYGHERFESVAAIVLAAILVVVGGTIGINAIKTIASGSYKEMQIPGMLALIASIVSIVAKTAMFFYTRVNANAILSTALKAEAWHHLSDALSSVGALIGIGGAMLGVAVLEPIASLVICIMILKAAIDIFRDAIDQMVDHSCDEEMEKRIRECIESQSGVEGIDLLHTRMFGNKVYVDVEIAVNADCSLREGHEIAEKVHDALEDNFGQIKHVMVHVNPAE